MPKPCIGEETMNKQSTVQHFKTCSTLIIGIVMMGVSPAGFATEGRLTIERNRSRDARIDHVYLPPSSDTLTLSGHLHKTMSRRGRIPGHIHVDMYGKQHQLLLSQVTDYHRHHRKSSYAHFYEQFPVNRDDVSRIVITHHGLDEMR